jgi:hypothetical protein
MTKTGYFYFSGKTGKRSRFNPVSKFFFAGPPALLPAHKVGTMHYFLTPADTLVKWLMGVGSVLTSKVNKMAESHERPPKRLPPLDIKLINHQMQNGNFCGILNTERNEQAE